MEWLYDLIADSDRWLIKQVIQYAKAREYVKYTSTLEDAWRVSISGLSNSILSALKIYDSPPELISDIDYTQDPIASFGILEAKKHRERGVTLEMFLGLMKYYRQSYVDLILKESIKPEDQHRYLLFINRFFDRVEIGFCMEWSALSKNETITELQSTNRRMTNEKNKYLTIFESLHDPVFLLNDRDQVENLNHAASELLEEFSIPGKKYYSQKPLIQKPPWVAEELAAFFAGDKTELSFEKQIDTQKGTKQFQIKFKRMLDVSEKFAGTVIILNDITEQKRVEEKLRKSENKLHELSSHLLTTQEDERKRIAVELHDDFGQSLILLKLRLCNLYKQIQDDQGGYNEEFEIMLQSVQQLIDMTRVLFRGLTPSMVDDLGLTHSIKYLANEFANLSPKKTLIEIPNIDKLFSSKTSIAIYRIIQEILTNIEKHADADNVSIVVEKNPQFALFRIEDDGKGFDDKQNVADNMGLGLIYMEERVRMFGGSFEVHSQLNQGTKVYFTIPFE